MLHVVGIALLVVVVWFLLSAGAVLILGGWLRRAGDVPTGPVTQQARAAARGAARLSILPYIIESTARDQARRRRRRG